MPAGIARGPLKVYTTDSEDFKVYCYGNAIPTLFNELEEIEATAYAPGANSQVDGHRVKRYPGDPGFIRAAHTRKNYINRGKSGASTTPGNRFWIEQPIQTDSGIVIVSHQATYTGSWADLVQYFTESNSAGTTLRRESSVALKFPPAAGP